MADDDKGEGAGGYRWLNEYEKTWEVLQEDDEGSLQATIDEIIQKAKRKRLLVRKGNVRLGMMRHLFIVVDMSSSMKESDLLRPSRIACTQKLLEKFIVEYFDQNPISQLGIIITKNKRAEKITDLSGNPKLHITALQNVVNKGCSGEPSLQNSLDTALAVLKHLPNHASREVLIIFGCLTTCDPGDINDSIAALKSCDIRCSIIGLSAEIRICKQICKETQGEYGVILDEKHFQDLLVEKVRPPEAKKSTAASLIRMGFPTHRSDGPLSLCSCHIDNQSECSLSTTGYFCPQCQSKYCELPMECRICGLTLVSAPHLAKSYQHLFPLRAFKELEAKAIQNLGNCKGCQRFHTDATVYECSNCEQIFCMDCDLFIHETLHTCPGCQTGSKANLENDLANGSL
ncbi:general transcription factor IIH subunit 2-like [Rhopilema esculentum]|uniref:general transcription factor IIH subunit 2-like n=1 Tax=Rhopilema esculentum TaxID=499914 RepID=UPI0031E2437F